MSSHNEACTDQEFIAQWKDLQSGSKVAAALGVSVRTAMCRRKRIERDLGITLPVFDSRSPSSSIQIDANRAVVTYKVTDGMVLVGSDAHLWPGPLTTMQRAFLMFAKFYKPAAIIANGDFFDGATVSRWPSIGWESKPSVQQELEAVQDYMDKLVKASPNSRRMWPLGNHDARLESRIAALLPEFKGVAGMHLKDHVSGWEPCWRVDINDDVVVRHRELGGEHADYRNVQTQGKTIVTGHDHRANVTAYNNYTGTKWGVRCGYMCDSPEDGQFVNYLEAKAPNWCPAFVLLTFKDGRLLWPELVTKHDDNSVQFRGQIVPC